MTTEYAARKNEECYSHVYILHHPDEEREACRPLRTAPAYDRQKARGAQFGRSTAGSGPTTTARSMRPTASTTTRAASAAAAGGNMRVAEAKAIREGVGLIDATAFTKHVVKGPGATAFLDWFTCNKLPKVGRINLTYALTAAAPRAPNTPSCGWPRTSITSSPPGPGRPMTRFPAQGRRGFHGRRFGWIVDDPGRDHAMGRLRHRRAEIARCAAKADQGRRPRHGAVEQALPVAVDARDRAGHVPGRAIRVAYTGELGWELHHPIEMQNYLWDQLMAAGEKHGLKLVGARAQNWLRQEKSYRAFGTELGRDATPLEAGLPRFVDLSKDFHGKARWRRRACGQMRHAADRRAGGCRSLGARGALCRWTARSGA
jgi:dimethylglycine dehydrogenase